MSRNNPTCAEKALVLTQKDLREQMDRAEERVKHALSQRKELEVALKDVNSALELLYDREYVDKRPF